MSACTGFRTRARAWAWWCARNLQGVKLVLPYEYTVDSLAGWQSEQPGDMDGCVHGAMLGNEVYLDE